jgi:membrane-bound metal-dependent hydrolase YbcI (DUF457 family)
VANFAVHVRTAAFVSSTLAIFGVSLNVLSVSHLPWFVLVGTFGGMLPDIDAAQSKPVKLLYHLLALLSAMTFLSIANNKAPSYLLLVMAGGVYGFARYAILASIRRFTVHRGIFHSLLAMFFFALLMICTMYYGFAQNALTAWLNGLFLAVGFLVHLLLDEMYSVDLSNRRLKKSFGSALKLYNYRNIWSSMLMACLTIYLFVLSPPLPSSLLMFMFQK